MTGAHSSPPDDLGAALQEHRNLFGETVSFAGIAAARPGEVTAMLRQAIRNRKPTSTAAIRVTLGMQPSPPGEGAWPLAVAVDAYRGRFGTAPWATSASPRDDLVALDWAVRTYTVRFGRGPAVAQFLRWPVALTQAIGAAVDGGQKLTADQLGCLLRMTPPPSGTT